MKNIFASILATLSLTASAEYIRQATETYPGGSTIRDYTTTNAVKDIVAGEGYVKETITNGLASTAWVKDKTLQKRSPVTGADGNISWNSSIDSQLDFNGELVVNGEIKFTGADSVLTLVDKMKFDTYEITSPEKSGKMALVDDIPDTWDWSAVVNTPTDISGYGITDAYTKSEIDAKGFVTESVTNGILTAAKTYADGKTAAATNALATVAHTGSYNDLTDRPPAGGLTTNDVKNIVADISIDTISNKASGAYIKYDLSAHLDASTAAWVPNGTPVPESPTFGSTYYSNVHWHGLTWACEKYLYSSGMWARIDEHAMMSGSSLDINATDLEFPDGTPTKRTINTKLATTNDLGYVLLSAKEYADQYANQAPDYATVSNKAMTAVQPAAISDMATKTWVTNDAINAINPVFSNAVLSVATNISTNDWEAIRELAELPVGTTAGGIGAVLAAIAAAIAALKKRTNIYIKKDATGYVVVDPDNP